MSRSRAQLVVRLVLEERGVVVVGVGVVDQDVEPAEGVDGVGDGRLDRRPVAHVAGQGLGGAARVHAVRAAVRLGRGRRPGRSRRTAAPSAASRRAVAAPMPCPAPVTRTPYPSKRVCVGHGPEGSP